MAIKRLNNNDFEAELVDAEEELKDPELEELGGEDTETSIKEIDAEEDLSEESGVEEL